MIKRIATLVLCMGLLALPLVAGDNFLEGKFLAAGIGYDAESVSGVIGWGAMGIPITGGLISYTDYDVSVLPGSDFQALLNGNALQFSMRTGLAQKILSIKNVSLFGLAGAGIGTGGAPSTVTKGSFSYGGFVDCAIGKGWGVDAILQAEKNASTAGFRFIPRFGVRYKF